jgi:hypothetical protein
MIPFNADYKRPFDVFRYFSKRQEVVRNGADYRWVIKTGEFLEHDCGSDCGKAASKYAFALRDNQSELMEELYSAGYILTFIENSTAPIFFGRGSHQILSLFKNGEYYGIALDPAFANIGVAGTPPDSEYRILSQPSLINYDAKFEDERSYRIVKGTAGLSISERELILGMAPELPLIYRFGTFYDYFSSLSRPFIAAISPDENSSTTFMINSANDYIDVDGGLYARLTPYQRNILSKDMLTFCDIYHEKVKPPKVLKPKRRK